MDMDVISEVKIDDDRNKMEDSQTVSNKPAKFSDHYLELIKHSTKLRNNLLVDKQRKREIKDEINRLSIKLAEVRGELKPWDKKRYALIASVQNSLLDKKIMSELVKGYCPTKILEEIDGNIQRDEHEIEALKKASSHLQEKASDFKNQIKRESQELYSLRNKIMHTKMDINTTQKDIDLMKVRMMGYGSRLWDSIN